MLLKCVNHGAQGNNGLELLTQYSHLVNLREVLKHIITLVEGLYEKERPVP